MKALRNAAIALVCITALFLARPAKSLPTGTTGTTVLAGTVVLVLYVMKVGPFEVKDGGTGTTTNNNVEKHVQLTDDEAQKLAESYLREVNPSLAEGLASGNGAVINDWARALKLPAGHEKQLGSVLHAHHDELLELAAANKLNPHRAAQFFERVAALIHADPVLSADLASQSI